MSPLYIEILLHIHCTPVDWEREHASACAECIGDFLDEGIIRARSAIENENTQHPHKYSTTERGDALVEALCRVPYPTAMWKVDYPADLIESRPR